MTRLVDSSQDPFGYGFDCTFIHSAVWGAATIGTANDGRYQRLAAGGYPMTKVGMNVSVQSGNISVAVYANTGTGTAAKPGTRLTGVGLTTARTVTDGVTTSGSPTLASATAAFAASDVGKGVSGTNIPASTTITAVAADGLSATMSANATASGTAISVALAAGIACPGTGFQTVTLLGACLPQKGDWIGISCDNATAQFSIHSTGLGSNLVSGLVWAGGSHFPLPSTPGGLSANGARNFGLVGLHT